jgi:shikimate kinase
METKSASDPHACPPPAAEPSRSDADARARLVRTLLGRRPVVLVGLMGAGKTTVGRRLAQRLGLAFLDADVEIEKAAAKTIPEIFAEHGEAYFRDGERRVIARLVADGPLVLATGGGAYMNADTRARIAEAGVSVWLKADLATLMSRVRRRANRPLLDNPDPEGTMRRLMEVRYPVYAEADVTVVSGDGSHDVVVEAVVAALLAFLDPAPAPAADGPAGAAPAP